MNKKILVLGGHSYQRIHSHLGEICTNRKEFLKKPENYCLVVFSGGADVDPGLYGEKDINLKTYINPRRDLAEEEVFEVAHVHKIPCTGICRGGQLLHVMAGGFLYQHVTNHGMAGTHYLRTNDGETISVSSLHHQMFGYPLPEGSKLLAWSLPSRSTTYQNGLGEEYDKPEYEPDVVFHPSIRSLSVQYHPEMMDSESDGYRYYLDILDEYIVPYVHKLYEKEVAGVQ